MHWRHGGVGSDKAREDADDGRDGAVALDEVMRAGTRMAGHEAKRFESLGASGDGMRTRTAPEEARVGVRFRRYTGGDRRVTRKDVAERPDRRGGRRTDDGHAGRQRRRR